jgi:hypothetical protein
MQKKTPAVVGSIIALVAFGLVASIPAAMYGGYAGVLLAGGLFGTPLPQTFLVKAVIVFGSILGVVGVGSLFAVSGAAAGAAVGALTSLAARKPAAAVAKE